MRVQVFKRSTSSRLWVCVILVMCVCARVCGRAEEIQEDNGLLKLTGRNFNQALQVYPELLVHFYAPLSGEAMGSILEFSRAAEKLKDMPSTVRLASVDVSKEKELAEKLNITIVPSIRLYLSSDKQNPVICPALRDSETILTWLKRRQGPTAEDIKNLSQLETFKELHEIAVLGLFNDREQGLVQMFSSVAAGVPDLPFGITHTRDIYRHFGATTDCVLLLRKGMLDNKLEMNSSVTEEALTDFIRIHEFDLVTEYNGKNAPQILNAVLKNHLVLFINKTHEGFMDTVAQLKDSARQFRGQVLCVLIDTDEPRNGRVLEFFRLRFEDAPLVRLVNMTDGQQYQLHTHTLDTPTISHFISQYLQGKVKPRLQSEPIPEGWDEQPVKELVGLNLEPVVFNENNNVLVLFYAAWCKESRGLFPLWKELAQRFSHQANVIVAQIDITTNDVNIRMLEKPPSIKLFPAVHAQRVIPYSGDRTAEALVEFVQREVKKAKKDKAKEDKERKKYIETVKAEEAKKKKEEL